LHSPLADQIVLADGLQRADRFSCVVPARLQRILPLGDAAEDRLGFATRIVKLEHALDRHPSVCATAPTARSVLDGVGPVAAGRDQEAETRQPLVPINRSCLRWLHRGAGHEVGCQLHAWHARPSIVWVWVSTGSARISDTLCNKSEPDERQSNVIS